MRVLLVNDLPPDPGSGAEVYLARLAAGLEAAGDTVDLFAGEVSHTGARKVLDLWDPGARRAVAARARAFGADVVHHHNVLRELSVAVLGVPAHVPTVLTVHDHRLLGVADGNLRGAQRHVDRWVKTPLDRRIARRNVDLAIAVSPQLADRLRAARFRRVAHVPVPVTPFPGLATTPVAAAHDVVFAGRLTADKGPVALAEAFLEIAGRHPDTRLHLAGDGPERSRLEALAARADGRIRCHGRLPHDRVAELFAGARVVAAPSRPHLRPEGAPLVIVEAALAGRPVVVADDPGSADLVERLGCGTAVAPFSVRAFADALDRLLDDDELATTLGKAGGEAARHHHDLDHVVARIRGLYREVVRDGR